MNEKEREKPRRTDAQIALSQSLKIFKKNVPYCKSLIEIDVANKNAHLISNQPRTANRIFLVARHNLLLQSHVISRQQIAHEWTSDSVANAAR